MFFFFFTGVGSTFWLSTQSVHFVHRPLVCVDTCVQLCMVESERIMICLSDKREVVFFMGVTFTETMRLIKNVQLQKRTIN